MRSLSDAVADFAKFLDDKVLVVAPPRVLRSVRLMPILLMTMAMTGPRVGRQAEITPADISIAVQPTVGAREYVGSLLVYEKRTLKR